MKKPFLASSLVALVVSLVVSSAFWVTRPAGQADAGPVSARDRILASGKIRVGYVNVAVGFNVDPKTKEKSGIFVDVLEEMARNMGLQVEYVEEVGWGTMIAGLQTKRYDMIASPVWPNSSRAKQATFSNPVYYSAIGIWVREDEGRFSPEGGWANLNDPSVKIGAFDGSTGERIAQTQFPQAKLLSYPESVGEGQLFLDVAGGKVDAFFEEFAKGQVYVRNNPGKVKNIAAGNPVKVFPNVFLLPQADFPLKEMIDTALAEVENSGAVERAIRKHEPVPNAYLRVAPPFRAQ